MASFFTIKSWCCKRKVLRPRRFCPKYIHMCDVVRLDTTFTFCYRPGWGYQGVSFRKGSDPAASPVRFPKLEGWWMKKKQAKAAAKEAGRAATLVTLESVLLKHFPNLLSHCAVHTYDDGTPRKLGTIQFGTHGSLWQLRAKDYDCGLQLTTCASNVDDALAALELFLGSDDAPWETDPFQAARGKKGPK